MLLITSVGQSPDHHINIILSFIPPPCTEKVFTEGSPEKKTSPLTPRANQPPLKQTTTIVNSNSASQEPHTPPSITSALHLNPTPPSRQPGHHNSSTHWLASRGWTHEISHIKSSTALTLCQSISLISQPNHVRSQKTTLDSLCQTPIIEQPMRLTHEAAENHQVLTGLQVPSLPDFDQLPLGIKIPTKAWPTSSHYHIVFGAPLLESSSLSEKQHRSSIIAVHSVCCSLP